MDLAKIRQKARKERETRQPEAFMPVEADLPKAAVSPEFAPTEQLYDDGDYFQNIEMLAVKPELPSASQILPPSRRAPSRDPFGVILAGRESAGCDENQSPASENFTGSGKENILECLCFKVSNEVYGIDIMDIKELIKPREVTEVPRAPSFVSGIISLRGVIIPIIDMLDRLGLARDTVTGRERIIVVRHGESFSGLLVDEIIQVVRIAKDTIEAAPTVLEGIDRDFVTGIGRADGRMVILLNITTIIDIHLY